MDLKFFTYSVLRYVPDPVRDERINMGVVVISDQSGESRCAFLPGARRKIAALNPNANVQQIERVIEAFKLRCGDSYLPTLFKERDPRLTSRQQLELLAETMKNQFQFSEPKTHRAESIDRSVTELFSLLIAVPLPDKAAPSRNMPLSHLRELIKRTIKEWASSGITVREGTAEQVEWVHHYADFWLVAGEPQEHLAALIAVPDNPDERHEAWALRDSVPAIDEAFRRFNRGFKVVVVFPPRSESEPAFIEETRVFLKERPGVIVTHVDELPDFSDKILPLFTARR